jgi:hypothetical protein
MSSAPSLAVRLYGTEEPASPPRILRAGRLSAELDAGNLRHIRLGDVELIRAISFIVRDRNWGTYSPSIANPEVVEQDDGFRVVYDAVARDDTQSFRYRAVIEATGSTLLFHGEGEAVTDFLTNRTGFVVLHPIEGVAGRPVEVTHVDGRVVEGRFPGTIDPVQPMKDLRALTHEAAPGLSVTCRMEGDTFEMEDQRNWGDASYKTYVRPLALPWPYTLRAGERIAQTVSLTIRGAAPAVARATRIGVTLGAGAGPAPALGLGIDPDDFAATRAALGPLGALAPAHLICHHDPRRDHDRGSLREAAALAKALGAEAWLEAVVVSVDDFEAEVAALGAVAAELGAPFAAVLLSPAADLKCTLPGSPWPPAPPARALFEATRRAFPGVRLGGGMFSFFTEMNRKPPPADVLDLVSFTTTGTMHAGDDHSVMEGLESLPAIAASARALAGDRPFAVGPSAIGMRMNPYGDAPMANPGNIRQAMNYNDPRQRGLLGAAWALGYYSHFARGGAQAVTLGAATGAFGAVHTPQDWPTPGFDAPGQLYPVFHVLRGLASLRGAPMTQVGVSEPAVVQGVCAGNDLWLANLTPEERLTDLPASAREAFVLDADSFAAAASRADICDAPGALADPGRLTLPPFAVARIMLG